MSIAFEEILKLKQLVPLVEGEVQETLVEVLEYMENFNQALYERTEFLELMMKYMEPPQLFCEVCRTYTCECFN